MVRSAPAGTTVANAARASSSVRCPVRIAVPSSNPTVAASAMAGDGSGIAASSAGSHAYQGRDPPSPSAAAIGPLADADAGGRPAQVDPSPRAIARMSPRTALLVSGPPAPGPAI